MFRRGVPDSIQISVELTDEILIKGKDPTRSESRGGHVSASDSPPVLPLLIKRSPHLTADHSPARLRPRGPADLASSLLRRALRSPGTYSDVFNSEVGCDVRCASVTTPHRNIAEAEILTGSGVRERVNTPQNQLLANGSRNGFRRVRFPASSCMPRQLKKPEAGCCVEYASTFEGGGAAAAGRRARGGGYPLNAYVIGQRARGERPAGQRTTAGLSSTSDSSSEFCVRTREGAGEGRKEASADGGVLGACDVSHERYRVTFACAPRSPLAGEFQGGVCGPCERHANL
ncbi:hypothetical protein EVAR_32229_1 [Eumeta japonica]|uniref:Uncharacterized protein n=1 Tax=Eumeta variegata TaxID=151549 RepID=A0A4C1YIP4_EUMVA|nr:hypothetical protein EVAR_32229_1 [Eumeta japonica]